jgi:hypothetical protein
MFDCLAVARLRTGTGVSAIFDQVWFEDFNADTLGDGKSCHVAWDWPEELLGDIDLIDGHPLTEASENEDL